MNYCAYLLLSIIHDGERSNRPELIPCPRKIRMDPEFSDALDILLDDGYVEVRSPGYFQDHNEWPSSDTGFFDPEMETLVMTKKGIAALTREEKGRVDLISN